MKTGFADSPLHYAKASRWPFDRMVKLSREITKTYYDQGELWDHNSQV